MRAPELGLTLEEAKRFAEAAPRSTRPWRRARRSAIAAVRWRALAGLARLDRQAGALDEAQARATRALDLVEQLRVGLLSTRARLTFGVTAQRVYEARARHLDRSPSSGAGGGLRSGGARRAGTGARPSLLEALTNGGTAVPAGDDASLALIARQRDLEADLEVRTARLGRLVDAGSPPTRWPRRAPSSPRWCSRSTR